MKKMRSNKRTRIVAVIQSKDNKRPTTFTQRAIVKADHLHIKAVENFTDNSRIELIMGVKPVMIGEAKVSWYIRDSIDNKLQKQVSMRRACEKYEDLTGLSLDNEEDSE